VPRGQLLDRRLGGGRPLVEDERELALHPRLEGQTGGGNGAAAARGLIRGRRDRFYSVAGGPGRAAG
jgi:hypothetical protein